MVVLARGLPVDHVLSRADDAVTACRTTGADAFGFLQEPDAHLEAEIGGSERADWANIDCIKRIIIFQALAGMRGQHGVTAAIDKSKHIVMRDLLAKPNAARADNAAFIIERNARPEHHVFRFLDFVFEKARFARAEIDAELL